MLLLLQVSNPLVSIKEAGNTIVQYNESGRVSSTQMHIREHYSGYITQYDSY